MSNAFYKSHMLRMIAHEPRDSRAFTEGSINLSVAPRIVERYLAEMMEDFLIREESGKYLITKHGQAVLDRPTSKAEPRTWCAASTSGTYATPAWRTRAGSGDHLQHRSLGL